ncbi:MAG: dephospho-CoA kinase [Pirellulales bacterium]
MLVIGLLGGVGSGKSLVAQEFVRLSAAHVDADKLGHQVLETSDVRDSLRNYFGSEVISPQGNVDRAFLARKVFSQSDSQAKAHLRYLEQQTHPRIRALMQQELERLQSQSCPVAVLDAPVMLEAGWDRQCDALVFVAAPRAVRLERVLRRGWQEADFSAREAAQESLDEKRRHADVIIDNSHTLACTRAQVERYWRSLFDTPPLTRRSSSP